MKYVCATQDTCTLEELQDLLQEMDRRYFLLQDLRWEFSILDREQMDTITAEQARYTYRVIHIYYFISIMFLRDNAKGNWNFSFDPKTFFQLF